jgi:hypothetical protein
MNLSVKELLTFVPSGADFQRTLAFYKALGFTADFESAELTLLRLGSCRFFLQNLVNAEMQNNFMMDLEVENLDDWWTHLQALELPIKFPGTRLRAPEIYPWGKREIHLIGPDGVLWHIATRA